MVFKMVAVWPTHSAEVGHHKQYFSSILYIFNVENFTASKLKQKFLEKKNKNRVTAE